MYKLGDIVRFKIEHAYKGHDSFLGRVVVINLASSNDPSHAIYCVEPIKEKNVPELLIGAIPPHIFIVSQNSIDMYNADSKNYSYVNNILGKVVYGWLLEHCLSLNSPNKTNIVRVNGKSTNDNSVEEDRGGFRFL